MTGRIQQWGGKENHLMSFLLRLCRWTWYPAFLLLWSNYFWHFFGISLEALSWQLVAVHVLSQRSMDIWLTIQHHRIHYFFLLSSVDFQFPPFMAFKVIHQRAAAAPHHQQVSINSYLYLQERYSFTEDEAYVVFKNNLWIQAYVPLKSCRLCSAGWVLFSALIQTVM